MWGDENPKSRKEGKSIKGGSGCGLPLRCLEIVLPKSKQKTNTQRQQNRTWGPKEAEMGALKEDSRGHSTSDCFTQKRPHSWPDCEDVLKDREEETAITGAVEGRKAERLCGRSEKRGWEKLRRGGRWASLEDNGRVQTVSGGTDCPSFSQRRREQPWKWGMALSLILHAGHDGLWQRGGAFPAMCGTDGAEGRRGDLKTERRDDRKSWVNPHKWRGSGCWVQARRASQQQLRRQTLGRLSGQAWAGAPETWARLLTVRTCYSIWGKSPAILRPQLPES